MIRITFLLYVLFAVLNVNCSSDDQTQNKVKKYTFNINVNTVDQRLVVINPTEMKPPKQKKELTKTKPQQPKQKTNVTKKKQLNDIYVKKYNFNLYTDARDVLDALDQQVVKPTKTKPPKQKNKLIETKPWTGTKALNDTYEHDVEICSGFASVNHRNRNRWWTIVKIANELFPGFLSLPFSLLMLIMHLMLLFQLGSSQLFQFLLRSFQFFNRSIKRQLFYWHFQGQLL